MCNYYLYINIRCFQQPNTGATKSEQTSNCGNSMFEIQTTLYNIQNRTLLSTENYLKHALVNNEWTVEVTFYGIKSIRTETTHYFYNDIS